MSTITVVHNSTARRRHWYSNSRLEQRLRLYIDQVSGCGTNDTLLVVEDVLACSGTAVLYGQPMINIMLYVKYVCLL